MKQFETFTGIIAPLNRSNVDTDAIIPKQFLKSIKRTGFGPYLFDDWRYLASADLLDPDVLRQPNPDFILNQPPYDQAQILLARKNFGCGSSREHAVWAMMDFGLKAVLAPSFADIFYTNACKNGFLPIRLREKEISAIFTAVEEQDGLQATVNLEQQTVSIKEWETYTFDIEPNLKERLLNGLDDIGMTLRMLDEIRAYEQRKAQIAPWLFS